MGLKVLQLFLVAAAVMIISHDIAKERVFSAFRAKLGGHNTYFGYLFSCPLCVSHWVSFVVTPLTGTFLIGVPWQWGALSTAITWFLNSMLVTATAAFVRVFFYWIDESQGLLRRKEKHEDEDIAIQELVKKRTELELEDELHNLRH